MYAKIQPVNYRTGQAKCLVVRNTSVQLGNRAVVEWSLMGEAGVDRRDYESGGMQLSGDDYLSWGSDDSYVYNWAATQLNLEIESIESGDYWAVQIPVLPPAPEETST